MPNSKSKSNPLTTPATPIALQPHHLLSPPADLLTNTATTLTITPTQDTKSPSQTFTIHRIRAHESPDSPDRTVPLYTVHGKPWPNTSRVLCDTEGIPVLVLRRVWLSRKWVVRRPDQQGELHTCHPCSPSLLPSYDSVRRDSPNSLRDLLDAVELPQEPVPAVLFRSSTSTSSSQNASASTSTSTSTSSDPGIGSGRTNAEASGSKVELRVMQLAASGTGVMMGNQKIMHITRHNAMDYSSEYRADYVRVVSEQMEVNSV
ncbi:hypothetical protein E8E15_005054 [Penicillium rubens]|nr:hypothetical protein E8E15_005054 [Penicillium rubens]